MEKTKAVVIAVALFLVCSPGIILSQDATPYKSGEKLKYLLHYGWLDGGEAVLSLNKKIYEGEEVYYTNATARSVGIADVLYKVYDVYESYFSSEYDLPIKAIRNIKEGNYRYYNELFFHHNEDSVLSTRSGKHLIPENCFDMLSALYYMRKAITDDMAINDTLRIETYFGDEIFPMVIRYKGIETVKTSLGKFECYKFVPVVEVGRVFKNEDDMIMWMSTKPNHVPISVRFDMLVGSLKCDLIEHENLKYGL